MIQKSVIGKGLSLNGGVLIELCSLGCFPPNYSPILTVTNKVKIFVIGSPCQWWAVGCWVSYPNCVAVHVALPNEHKAIVKASWNRERKHCVAISAKWPWEKHLQHFTQVHQNQLLLKTGKRVDVQRLNHRSLSSYQGEISLLLRANLRKQEKV